MANANKQKGKQCEREIATELREVFNLSFTRVPNSGAYVGGRNFFRTKQLSKEQNLLMDGDIIMPIELAHMKVEAKFYADFSWQSCFENNEQLNKWIDQAKGQDDKLWFLVMKFNNQGKFVVFDAVNGFVSSTQSRFLYKQKYTICRYDGFFTTNKEAILNWKKPNIPIESISVLQPAN